MDLDQGPRSRGRVCRRRYSASGREPTSNHLHPPTDYGAGSGSDLSINPAAPNPTCYFRSSHTEDQYHSCAGHPSLWQPSSTTEIVSDSLWQPSGALSALTAYSADTPYSGSIDNSQHYHPTTYHGPPSFESGHDGTTYSSQRIEESSMLGSEDTNTFAAQGDFNIASSGYGFLPSNSLYGMGHVEQTPYFSARPNDYALEPEYGGYRNTYLDAIDNSYSRSSRVSMFSSYASANTEICEPSPSLAPVEDARQRKRKPSLEESILQLQKKGRPVSSSSRLPLGQVQNHRPPGQRPIAPAPPHPGMPFYAANVKQPPRCMLCRTKKGCCKSQPKSSKCDACQTKIDKRAVNTSAWKQRLDLDSFQIFGPDQKKIFWDFCGRVLGGRQGTDAPANEVGTCHIGLHSGPYPTRPSRHSCPVPRLCVPSVIQPHEAHLRSPVFDPRAIDEFLVKHVFASSEVPDKYSAVNRGPISSALKILILLSAMRNPDSIMFYFEDDLKAHQAKQHALDLFHSILWTVDRKLWDLGGRINTAAGSEVADWEVFLACHLLCASIRKHGKCKAKFRSRELGDLDTFWEHVERQIAVIHASLRRRVVAYGVHFCEHERSPDLHRFIQLRDWQRQTFKPIITVTFAKRPKGRSSQTSVPTPMGLSILQVLRSNSSTFKTSVTNLSDLGLGNAGAKQQHHPGDPASSGMKTPQKPWVEGDVVRCASPAPLPNTDAHGITSEISNETFGAGSWTVDQNQRFDTPPYGFGPLYSNDPLLGDIPSPRW